MKGRPKTLFFIGASPFRLMKIHQNSMEDENILKHIRTQILGFGLSEFRGSNPTPDVRYLIEFCHSIGEDLPETSAFPHPEVKTSRCPYKMGYHKII